MTENLAQNESLESGGTTVYKLGVKRGREVQDLIFSSYLAAAMLFMAHNKEVWTSYEELEQVTFALRATIDVGLVGMFYGFFTVATISLFNVIDLQKEINNIVEAQLNQSI